jgi:hypothetical protein
MPLPITDAELDEGLAILADAVSAAVAGEGERTRPREAVT